MVFRLLNGTPNLPTRRIGARVGHFMPPSLLASQQQTLESFRSDAGGFVLSIVREPAALVGEVVERLHSPR